MYAIISINMFEVEAWKFIRGILGVDSALLVLNPTTLYARLGACMCICLCVPVCVCEYEFVCVCAYVCVRIETEICTFPLEPSKGFSFLKCFHHSRGTADPQNRSTTARLSVPQASQSVFRHRNSPNIFLWLIPRNHSYAKRVTFILHTVITFFYLKQAVRSKMCFFLFNSSTFWAISTSEIYSKFSDNFAMYYILYTRKTYKGAGSVRLKRKHL